MKVRGFQVAPAELEGCILDHPDVVDACVVGVPDEYSTFRLDGSCAFSTSWTGGEVPMAFVVLSGEANQRLKQDSAIAGDIKSSILKVSGLL
jgi:acyl-CoA synthetase (AMP-forming)/AMP-acid ligase II